MIGSYAYSGKQCVGPVKYVDLKIDLGYTLTLSLSPEGARGLVGILESSL
jgi:hypothetical protein